MTTKEQERKALEQIKKIVEGLGKDSYIGTAFEGCFEVAETNIENDWACSYKQEIKSLEERVEKQAKDIELLMHQKDHLSKKVDEQMRQSERNFQSALENAEDCREWMRKCEEGKKAFEELNRQNSEMINEIADKDVEIMKLKAKLYDLMMKEVK